MKTKLTKELAEEIMDGIRQEFFLTMGNPQMRFTEKLDLLTHKFVDVIEISGPKPVVEKAVKIVQERWPDREPGRIYKPFPRLRLYEVSVK